MKFTMSVFQCKMCGGTLEIQENESVATCEYCGTKQTIPRLSNEKKANLYDRAGHFRRNDEFDRAMGIYNQILDEDPSDAEAYWSLVLCRYGIVYVEDPATHRRVPTVNRMQLASVLADEDYKMALQNAAFGQRELYEAEARAIDQIQKGILEISSNEEPFDVFICYKEADATGRRTQDSVLANDLYNELATEGYRVFFSRITLEDKIGSAYEPYIFAALHSAKVMVVLGTKPEYFQAVWVKNEWSRFLALIKAGEKKVLIPAYKDMDPYDLPEEFSHLQAQDMGKLGFMQDLIRGIRKIADNEEKRETERVIVTDGASVEPLLKRVFLFLEDEDWNSADSYCERVLDLAPENARAYLGKLMAEMQVPKQEQLADCSQPFDDRNSYKKAVRFADEELAAVLKGYIVSIRERNEKERMESDYQKASDLMQQAKHEQEYRRAAELFQAVSPYKDASVLAETCRANAEHARNENIYLVANENLQKSFITLEDYKFALEQFETIAGWKDAEEKAQFCRIKIEEIKLREERERAAQEHRTKTEALRGEDSGKKKRTAGVAAAAVVLAGILLAFLWYTVIKPVGLSVEEADGSGVSAEGGDLFDSSKEQDHLELVEGARILFGSYMQSVDRQKDPIEWQIIDRKENQVLLLSVYGLDCQAYSQEGDYAAWENSSLRVWLNTDCLNEMFSETEQKCLIPINEVDAEDLMGDIAGLEDKVFLLSKDEMKHLYVRDRKCQVTEYAKSQGADADDEGYGKWMLRAPVFNDLSISVVLPNGDIASAANYMDSKDCAVRPAVWVNMDYIRAEYEESE